MHDEIRLAALSLLAIYAFESKLPIMLNKSHHAPNNYLSFYCSKITQILQVNGYQ